MMNDLKSTPSYHVESNRSAIVMRMLRKGTKDEAKLMCAMIFTGHVHPSELTWYNRDTDKQKLLDLTPFSWGRFSGR